MKLLDKILRAGEGKRLKAAQALVAPINALEPEIHKLSDRELQGMTATFRERLANGATLDDIMPEAFAVVRETASRVIGQRHYDVQLIGGAALHWGSVAEMKTGEGKTLVSTLPVYLNALAGQGVHVVTVNDYLASRDADWMGQIHRWLGLTIGLVVPGNTDTAFKQAQYACDITYGTNNEYGFDYLRDNMARSLDGMTQRGHFFAIVDEIDSILIDEARTPLIISGRARGAADLYYRFAEVVRRLERDVDYDVDEEKRLVAPTDEGVDKVEEILEVENLYDGVQGDLVHQLQAALRAKELFHRDKDYLVADGEVKIVDEFTGRILEGRRWSDGLHQAVEAKEGVKIKEEQQTLATVTLQNYFRMYDKLAGMTGTALADAAELETTYGLAVVQIPTNRPMVRVDAADLIYKSEESKFAAVVDDLEERVAKGQPVLVGTASVEKSEKLGRLLDQRGISHEVLNAKQHFREADIVAQAGQPGVVTVATNMAGRGVDIILGGNAEKLAERDTKAEGLDPNSDEGAAYLQKRLDYWAPICEENGDQGARRRRPVRAGHRTAREPPHRRPAPGPVGPPGRSGREPVLPVAGRRPDADLRHRRHELGDGPGPPRRRAHRVQDGHQVGRAGPEHGGAAQRRGAQERPQVRRGVQPAAQGDLQASPADPGAGRSPRRDGRGHRHGGPVPGRDPLRGRPRRRLGPRGAPHRAALVLAHRSHGRGSGPADGSTDLQQLIRTDGLTRYEAVRSSSPPTSCARSSARSCSS